MDNQTFLASLEDLTGRVVIVTGGAAGIGLESTIYLARKGATVYVASRNKEKSENGIKLAKERLGGEGGPILFHELDLATIEGARSSAAAFLKRESRLDVLICNAGIAVTYRHELSKDGYEKMFATNHMGHFVFVLGLLDLIKGTAKRHGEARIVVTASIGHRSAPKIDYSILQTRVEGDGKSIFDIATAFKNYSRTKLMNIYFAAELARRLRDEGIDNIYCNSCHPGTVGFTGLTGSMGEKHPIPQFIQNMIHYIVHFLVNTVEDAGRCQVYLAASKKIADEGITGKYWEPTWTWFNRYKGCAIPQISALAKDEEEQKKLWKYSEDAVAKADGGRAAAE